MCLYSLQTTGVDVCVKAVQIPNTNASVVRENQPFYQLSQHHCHATIVIIGILHL